jgi:hypothetical protein
MQLKMQICRWRVGYDIHFAQMERAGVRGTKQTREAEEHSPCARVQREPEDASIMYTK